MPQPSPSRRPLVLGVFLHAAGYHVAGWRHPDAIAATEDISHLVDICIEAERGKFQLAFLGDSLNASSHTAPSQLARLEPLTLLSAIAMRTRHIGLAATASTTYTQPFHVARQFASLDHISRGRAGWNVVTSATPADAANFGMQAHPDATRRYARAEEFVDVVRGLWDTWQDGALIRDKASGQYVDNRKFRPLDHVGEHFQVAGPLNISRSPQGHPVLIQAGASPEGKALAARVADVIFTAQSELSAAQAFYREMKTRVAAHGRHPDSVAILPGIMPIVGRTDAQAQERFQALQALIDTDHAIASLSHRFGVDLSACTLDGYLPDNLPDTNGFRSRIALLAGIARRDRLTLRELYRVVAASNGHRLVIGSPDRVADEIQAWHQGSAADGFNIMAPYFPGALTDFVDLVVPVLQQRGLFHLDYPSDTLRGNLGLARPGADQHTRHPSTSQHDPTPPIQRAGATPA